MAAQRWSFGWVVFALFYVGVDRISGLNVEYCSSLNTADTAGSRSPPVFFGRIFTDTSADYSMYQSNGLCQQFCISDYAFAVLQGSDCYCSNYVPGTTVSGDNCNEQCSGYPDDLCGGTGVYGYIALSLAPSGTRGASSTSNPSSTTVSSSTSVAAPVSTPFMNPCNYSISLFARFDVRSVASCLPMPINGNRFDFLL